MVNYLSDLPLIIFTGIKWQVRSDLSPGISLSISARQEHLKQLVWVQTVEQGTPSDWNVYAAVSTSKLWQCVYWNLSSSVSATKERTALKYHLEKWKLNWEYMRKREASSDWHISMQITTDIFMIDKQGLIECIGMHGHTHTHTLTPYH